MPLIDPGEVRARLRRLGRAARRSLPGLRDGHGFELRAPLSERTVRDYERRHGVTLPDQYRRFVTEVGDGGAGPNYGLFRLRDVFEEPWLGRGDPTKPFRHTHAWNLPRAKQRERAYWHPRWLDGAVPISHHGCGYLDWLVVNGPFAGTLWYDAREHLGGLVPLFHRRARLVFDVWYLEWLDRCDARLELAVSPRATASRTTPRSFRGLPPSSRSRR